MPVKDKLALKIRKLCAAECIVFVDDAKKCIIKHFLETRVDVLIYLSLVSSSDASTRVLCRVKTNATQEQASKQEKEKF